MEMDPKNLSGLSRRPHAAGRPTPARPKLWPADGMAERAHGGSAILATLSRPRRPACDGTLRRAAAGAALLVLVAAAVWLRPLVSPPSAPVAPDPPAAAGRPAGEEAPLPAVPLPQIDREPAPERSQPRPAPASRSALAAAPAAAAAGPVTEVDIIAALLRESDARR